MHLSNFYDYLSKEKNYSSNTVIAYKKDVETFQEFCRVKFELNNLLKVTYPIIREWIIDLSEKELSPLSINRKISSLSKYYDFLIKINDLKSSPLKNHKRLKVQKKLIIPFSEDEVLKVVDVFSKNFEGKRNLLIVDMLYSTGVRRDELINIKLNDVLLDENLVKVLGKRNKERLVPLVLNLKSRINDYLKFRNEIKSSSSNFFITTKGKKIGPSLVYRVVKNYFSKVSTKVKTSPHVLRHSFATHMLNNGADINSIKEIMGHSSLASTQIYTKIKLPKIINDYKKNHPRERKK
jgi:integrase/recombinase XerC